MKKQLLLFAAMAVMAGCTAEMDQVGNVAPETAGSGKLTARIGDVETRVAFDEFTGEFSWTAGDQIDVHTTAGYQTAALDANGCFNLTSGSVRDGYAVYPTGVVTSDSDLTLELPDSYDIEAGGMADFYPSPMVALNDPSADDIWFYHAGAVARLVFTELPAETRSILVTLDKRVTGTFVVADPGTDHPVIETDGAATGNTVRFNLDGAPTVSEDGFALNVPIPTGTFNSITASIQDASNAELLSYASKKVRTFPRARGRKIDPQLERYYFLDNLSATDLVIPSRAAASASATFRSYYTISGSSEQHPVDVAVDYSLDGTTWTTGLPAGLEGFATEGDVEKTGTVSVGLNLNVDHVVSNSYAHARELDSRTAVGSEGAPWDLSMHTVTGAERTAPVTANCYIVNRGGWYMFPLVYGNAIDWTKNPSTGVNSAAWTDGTGEANHVDTEGHVDIYHTFQRHDQQGITGPYILQNLGLTSTQVSPVIVWEDVRDAAHAFIPSSSLSIIESGGIPYIRFHVADECTVDEQTGDITGIRQGNAVIALREGTTGPILWSWHIWVTDQEMAPVTVGTKSILPADLGWCDTKTDVHFTERDWYVRIRPVEGDADPLVVHVHQNSSVSHWNSGTTLYQWGRKDPFIPVAFYESPEGTQAFVSKPVFSPMSAPLFWGSATVDGRSYGTGISAKRYEIPASPEPFSSGAGDGITYPFRIYYGNPYPNSTNNHECTLAWMCSDYPFNLWYMGAGTNSAAHSADLHQQGKTVYDPCPPGFSIPNYDVFSALSGGVETEYGWEFGSIMFPLTGSRVAYNGSANGKNTGHWMNVASTFCNAYFCSFSAGVSELPATMRGSQLAVRPMAE